MVPFRVKERNVINTRRAGDVLYVHGMAGGLISLSRLTDSGIILTFTGRWLHASETRLFHLLRIQGGWDLQTVC